MKSFLQLTEDRGQRTVDRGQRTEDRGQWTEERGQWTEDRGQRTEDSDIYIKCCAFVPTFNLLSLNISHTLFTMPHTYE